MRDEIEEQYLTTFDDETPGLLRRWLPGIVVVGVVASFVTLAWYAYHAGTQAVKDEDLLIVEADKTPVKEKPLDPGGMKFPDQDKTVFNTFSGSPPASKPKGEEVLPPPEEPAPVTANTSGTTTWINDKLKKDEQPKPAVPATAEEIIGPAAHAAAPVAVPAAEKKSEPAAPPEIAVASAAPKAPAANAESENPAASVPEEKPAAKKTTGETPEEPAKKTDNAPAKEAVADSDAIKVQLGAYRSKNEAEISWRKMQKKHETELSGMQPSIVKADLGRKGVYYRLQLHGFFSVREAREFCAKLTAHGQACILPGGK